MCTHMYVCEWCGMCLEVRRQFVEALSYRVVSGDFSQVHRVGNKCLSPLNHSHRSLLKKFFCICLFIYLLICVWVSMRSNLESEIQISFSLIERVHSFEFLLIHLFYWWKFWSLKSGLKSSHFSFTDTFEEGQIVPTVQGQSTVYMRWYV